MGEPEGLEGRTKLLSDEKFRALNKALVVDKKKPQGRRRNKALERGRHSNRSIHLCDFQRIICIWAVHTLRHQLKNVYLFVISFSYIDMMNHLQDKSDREHKAIMWHLRLDSLNANHR